MDNPHEGLPFDIMIFKREWSGGESAADPVSYRSERILRTAVPGSIEGLRKLPFPPFILRELWLRTQYERVWRRLVVHDLSIEEIEWWGPDEDTNPHAR